MMPYLKNEGVLKCPSDGVARQNNEKTRTYSWCRGPFGDTGVDSGVALATIPQPASLIHITERPHWLNKVGFRDYSVFNIPTEQGPYPAERHRALRSTLPFRRLELRVRGWSRQMDAAGRHHPDSRRHLPAHHPGNEASRVVQGTLAVPGGLWTRDEND